MVYNNLDFRTLRCKTGATIPKCPERLCKVRTFCLICNALLPHILQFFSVFPPFFQNADIRLYPERLTAATSTRCCPSVLDHPMMRCAFMVHHGPSPPAIAFPQRDGNRVEGRDARPVGVRML